MTETVFRANEAAYELARPASSAPAAIGVHTMASLCWAALAFGFAGSFSIHAMALAMPADQTGLALGLSAALQAVGVIVGAPLAVWFLQRTGSRQLALTACLLAAAALAMLSLMPGGWLIAAVRLVLGIGLGLGVTVTEYVLTARAAPGRRSLVIALYATCCSIGAALGPAAIYCIGASPEAYALGVAALGSAAVALCRSHLRARIEKTQAMATLDVVRQVPFATVAALIYGLLSSGLLDLIGVFAVRHGHSAADGSLVALAGLLGVLLLQVPVGHLSDRLTPARLLPLCALLTLGVLAAFVNVASVFWALCASAFVLGGLCDAFYTVGLAALAERVPRTHLAAANACFVSFCGTGEIVGPLVAGAGMDIGGVNALLIPFALLMAAYYAIMRGARARPPLAMAH